MTDPITNLHYAANGNIVNGQYAPGSVGFNLADVSSVDQLNALPQGVKGLVWLGMGDGATASFQNTVSQFAGNPNLYGFYLVDEPDPSKVSAANLMAESDWIHAHVPGAKTFIVLQNMGTETNPVFNYNPANTHVDLFGLDPYPVQTQFGGANYNTIPIAVHAAEASGIAESQIVPVYQAFGTAGWIMPTASQEQQILSTWGSVVSKPAFDYAYSWGVQNGDSALSTSPDLQKVFAAHNALGTSSTGGSGGTTTSGGSTSGGTSTGGGTTGGDSSGTTSGGGSTTGSTGSGGTTSHHGSHHNGSHVYHAATNTHLDVLQKGSLGAEISSLAGNLSSSGGASSNASIDLSDLHLGASNAHHQANSWSHGDAQGSILVKALTSAIVDQSSNAVLPGVDEASHALNGSDHGHGVFAAHAHSQSLHLEHMWS